MVTVMLTLIAVMATEYRLWLVAVACGDEDGG